MALLPPLGRGARRPLTILMMTSVSAALLALALVVSFHGQTTFLYQTWKWHTLRPDGILRADANYGYSTVPIHGHGVKRAHRDALKPFFGLQHFPGHGLASSPRAPGLVPSSMEAGTQMLHQNPAKSTSNLPALWSEMPAATSPRKKSRAHEQSQQLKEYTPQSSFININTPDTVDADGYMDAGAYRQELTANAAKGQAAYVANWKAKNLKAGKQMVKDAAKLYAKWDLVDPYTGRSSPNLVIPHDTSDGYDESAQTPRMRLYKNGPMLTDAHLMMLKEVTADNGRTYVLPWWCVVVHPEANGDGRPTGLSDAYGQKYPEGKGWDGATTPMGASGIPGVDCTHPGGSTLVPYDKDWPLYKGPRVPEAQAEAISDEEAAELEEGEEEAAQEEEPSEEDTGEGEDAEAEAEPAAVEEGGDEEEAPAEAEPAEEEGSDAADEGEAPAGEAPVEERGVAGAQMLASEWPAGEWRHTINTDNALSKPGLGTSKLNSDGPEYNVMEDDFVFPDYKGGVQMLADTDGDLESDDVGDEIFELPQGQGDVQMQPSDLEYTIFPGHYY